MFSFKSKSPKASYESMSITTVIFSVCSVLAGLLIVIILIRRYKAQLTRKMGNSQREAREKSPRFRKRDKVAFYGRKLLRKVAESVEQKKKLIPKKRGLARSNTTETYLRREPSDYFLDPELAKYRHKGPTFFLRHSSSGVTDDIPLEMYYLLKSVRVFGYLERPLFLELFKFIETKHIAAGLYLFNIGDPDDHIYVVQTGKIVVSVRYQDTEWPVKEVTSGESIYSLLSFIGVLTNREEKMKTISAKAVCDTTVVKLPFRAFIPLFAKYPETMIRVIQVIMVRMQRVTFATLHDNLGLCEELMLPICPQIVSSAGASLSKTSPASKTKTSNSKKQRPLHKSNTVGHLVRQQFSGSESEPSPVRTIPGSSPIGRSSSPSPMVSDKSKNSKGVELGDSDKGGKSRDASPKVKWSSVHFDPSGRKVFRSRKNKTHLRGTLLNNDEFNNVLGRARLENLESKTSDSAGKTNNDNLNDEPFASDLNFFKNSVSPRQRRSYSLSFGHTTPSTSSKLRKQDVNENVYVEAVYMFAKALGLPANKSYLLNDKLQLHNCTAGSVLLEEGTVNSSIVLVMNGQLVITMKNNDNVDVTIYTPEVGEIAGTIPVLTGEPNMFSLKAKTASRVVVLSKQYFYELISSVPSIVLKVSHDIVATMSPFVRQADFSLDWMQLEAGKSVYRQGDKSDATYLVINGRLRSVWQNIGATKKELEGEYGRGDLVGMVELLTERERKTSVHAVRDTELAVIPVGLLDFIKAKYPGTVAKLIQILSQKMMTQHEDLNSSSVGMLGAKTLSNISTIAIVPSNDAVPLAYFTMELLWCINSVGPSIRLTSSDIVNKFGDTAFDMVNDYKLSNFLSQVEDHHKIVMYQTDKTLSSWTQRCIRQADCIIILAVADQDPKVGEIEKQVDRIGVRAQKELVLLYKPLDSSLKAEGSHKAPVDTVQWLNNRDWVTLHHHIRCKSRIFSRKTPSKWLEYYSPILSRPPDKHSDFSRLARHLTNTSVGLVLGGGGARGAAHLGVIKALQENDIPVDMIGGTSIGSFVGALYAQYRHRPLDSFIKRTREWFMVMSSNLLKLLDLTYPHTAFFSGKIFNTQIHNVFEELQIEDLWIPYFCVSTDITTSSIRIHTSGDIWRYVRSSMSLSGYLPPLCDPSDGHLLLDGGYVNNLPADVMKELWNPKRVIAVDVGSQDSQNLTNYGDHLSGWWVLAKKWNPFSTERIRVPGMEEIQSRLAYVLCKKQLDEVKNSAYCDYVRPPIDRFRTLSFGRFDDIYQLGYDHAAALFQQWVKANYLVKLLDDITVDTDEMRKSLGTNTANLFRRSSKRDNIDEFAQVASRLSRYPLSDHAFSTGDSSDMGEEDEDERDEREVFNQPRQDSVFNRQMETQAMIDEDVSETDPTRIVPHREIETEDYELENEGEVDDAFEDDNLEAQELNQDGRTSADTIKSLTRGQNARDKFTRGNAGRTRYLGTARNRYHPSYNMNELMQSVSFGEGSQSHRLQNEMARKAKEANRMKSDNASTTDEN
ncbi:patatin-like phospholipase domain-containing protein 7 isoform X3 [Convolutriloba macropyga]|uniref:patatin-like phospholipase domain-containing protein 7 isoform X3 n=1 Tax=Convolutriloba macropyga TaxID=536237 RepID=UPI003F51AD3F